MGVIPSAPGRMPFPERKLLGRIASILIANRCPKARLSRILHEGDKLGVNSLALNKLQMSPEIQFVPEWFSGKSIPSCNIRVIIHVRRSYTNTILQLLFARCATACGPVKELAFVPHGSNTQTNCRS